MRDLTNMAMLTGVFVSALTGWAAAGYVGAALGTALGVLLLVLPWHGQPLWSWLDLYLRRNRPLTLGDPVSVVNDRSGGGVRYQDGIAAVAIHILGKSYSPTYFTGTVVSETADILPVNDLLSLMRQSLGLTLDSISVISSGSRRCGAGDYPRVYDTLIGTPPYAGQRETWLIIRIRARENGEALRWRSTVGTAALAAAQRIAMTLRCKGVRARVATATDIAELDRRLGLAALEPGNRRWHSGRGEVGWQTTYAYRPADISTETLAQAWSLRVDAVVQNLTLFPDGGASATVTVSTAKPPTAPPAVWLQSLPGEQAPSVAANLCGPRPVLRGAGRGPLSHPVVMPVGPSGVLIGKTGNGDRLLIPLTDLDEQTRVHIAADDSIAKRIVIRTAAAGERITVHTTNIARWDSVRIPNVAVVDHQRPVSGTTVSVIDGTVRPTPRPGTVISVGVAGPAVHPAADVVIAQTGRDTVEITTGDRRYAARLECFRAENRYASAEPADLHPEPVVAH